MSYELSEAHPRICMSPTVLSLHATRGCVAIAIPCKLLLDAALLPSGKVNASRPFHSFRVRMTSSPEWEDVLPIYRYKVVSSWHLVVTLPACVGGWAHIVIRQSCSASTIGVLIVLSLNY